MKRRIFWSSTRNFPNSFFVANQRLRHSSVTPRRKPVGQIFCPMLSLSLLLAGFRLLRFLVAVVVVVVVLVAVLVRVSVIVRVAVLVAMIVVVPVIVLLALLRGLRLALALLLRLPLPLLPLLPP